MSKKVKKSISRKFQMYCLITGLVGCFIAGNWVYQVARKPSELFGVFDSWFSRTPRSTWYAYGSAFRDKATSIMTPDFLAALAHTESNGVPVARTYWKLRLTADLDKIYAPASSATGMFQITQAAFDEAKQFCVRGGHVYKNVPGQSPVCWGGFAYSRLIPSHAIEMTSARLHYYTVSILEHLHIKRIGLTPSQDLATIIHLCGPGKGRSFARAGFNARRIGKCGDHDPQAYLTRVHALRAKFREMLGPEYDIRVAKNESSSEDL